MPDRRTDDDDEDCSPAVPAAPSTAPTDGAPVETPRRDAALPRPRQEPVQREGAGEKRSRRKRRRRGERNRDGSTQEASPRERGASPAASIGSVVDPQEPWEADREAPAPRQEPDTKKAVVRKKAAGIKSPAEPPGA